MEDAEFKKAKEVVTRCVNQIMEYMDDVQIFCSRSNSGTSAFIQQGAGNYFSRLGQAQRWLDIEKQNDIERYKEHGQ